MRIKIRIEANHIITEKKKHNIDKTEFINEKLN